MIKNIVISVLLLASIALNVYLLFFNKSTFILSERASWNQLSVESLQDGVNCDVFASAQVSNGINSDSLYELYTRSEVDAGKKLFDLRLADDSLIARNITFDVVYGEPRFYAVHESNKGNKYLFLDRYSGEFRSLNISFVEGDMIRIDRGYCE